MRETPVFKVDGVTAPGAPGRLVVVAARNPARPLIAASGDVTLAIGARGTLVLDGLVVVGRRADAGGGGRRRAARAGAARLHAGAGPALQPDGSAVSPGAPSLVIEHPFAKVTLERCITGPIQIDADAELTHGRLHRRCRRRRRPSPMPPTMPAAPGAELTARNARSSARCTPG